MFWIGFLVAGILAIILIIILLVDFRYYKMVMKKCSTVEDEQFQTLMDEIEVLENIVREKEILIEHLRYLRDSNGCLEKFEDRTHVWIALHSAIEYPNKENEIKAERVYVNFQKLLHEEVTLPELNFNIQESCTVSHICLWTSNVEGMAGPFFELGVESIVDEGDCYTLNNLAITLHS